MEVELDEVNATDNAAWEEREMSASDATLYCGIVARCNLLPVDRPDIMFASKECSRCMSKPLIGDWEP